MIGKSLIPIIKLLIIINCYHYFPFQFNMLTRRINFVLTVMTKLMFTDDLLHKHLLKKKLFKKKGVYTYLILLIKI